MQQRPLLPSVRAIAEAHAAELAIAQHTGPLKPIRLTTTDPIPVVKPPTSTVIHLGSVQSTLVHLTFNSLAFIVTGYRMAYLHQPVYLADAKYIITDVWADTERPHRIMARLEREDG